MESTMNDGHKGSIEEYKVEDYDEGEEEEKDDLSEETLLALMGYAESEPKRNNTKIYKPKRNNTKIYKKQYYDDDDEEEGEDETNFSDLSLFSQCQKDEPPKHDPITTPTATLNLVSALKGSREKEGKSGHELRVSWAPDVYDPPTSSPDLFATDRPKIEHKVKNAAVGKNKQKTGGKGAGKKGNVGGGGKSGVKDKNKDKKQVKRKSAAKYSSYED